jgi:hypothetical protein
VELLADKPDAAIHEAPDRVAAVEHRLDIHGRGMYQGIPKGAPEWFLADEVISDQQASTL